MPRPPKLFFSSWPELQSLLCRVRTFEKEPGKPKGRPYDPEDLELYARWNADRESGLKWTEIGEKRLRGYELAADKIKQDVRRYKAFCKKHEVEEDTLLHWAEEWRSSPALTLDSYACVGSKRFCRLV